MNKVGIYVDFDRTIETDTQRLKLIKQAGFDSVMLYGGNNLEEQVKTSNELELRIGNVHMPYAGNNNLWIESAEGEDYMEFLIEQLKRYNNLEIVVAVMHLTSGDPIKEMPTINKCGLKRIAKLIKIAEKLNIKIAVENLTFKGKDHLFYILDNIKSENLGFCYDCGHHNLYIKQEDMLKKYSNRVLAVHFHDNLGDWKEGMDWQRDLHLIPFDGSINWDKITSKVANSSYNGSLTLELHKDFSEKYTTMNSLEYLIKAKDTALKISKMCEQKSK